jgi:hypothetical protein
MHTFSIIEDIISKTESKIAQLESGTSIKNTKLAQTIHLIKNETGTIIFGFILSDNHPNAGKHTTIDAIVMLIILE